MFHIILVQMCLKKGLLWDKSYSVLIVSEGGVLKLFIVFEKHRVEASFKVVKKYFRLFCL